MPNIVSRTAGPEAAAALSASQEDYLETILHLVEEGRVARPRDIAARMRVNRSSVTGALQALAARGLVHYAPYDWVTLTASGRLAAADVARRHSALRDFLVKVLGVPPDEAEEAACGMEHAVPPKLLHRFRMFLDFAEADSKGARDWIARFRRHCAGGAARRRGKT